MTQTSATVALGVAADAVLDALDQVGATHVVTVPDTHQRTVMEALDARAQLPVVRATTEDDVLAICAGLWLAGARPVALIQQLGLFAAANALRALTHDHHVALAILAGMYGRETDLRVEDSGASGVRLCVPLLDALRARHALVESPADADLIRDGLAAAFGDPPCTSVVLLGAPTT